MFDFSVEKTTKNDLFDTVDKWDMLIIGGGPAGINAALYAKRKGLEVGIIADDVGGQLHNTTAIDNYLGFTLVKGEELANSFIDHVNALDIPILKKSRVSVLTHLHPDFQLTLSDGRVLISKTVLLATGGSSRKLNIPGEKEFSNKGVTYCATCDAPFFKDKHVIVSGGGNSAAEGVLDLVPFARKITVVHRSQWRADDIILDKLNAVEKLTVHLETEIKEVVGEDFMTGVKVFDKNTKEERVIEADGLLIEIGTIPNSTLVSDLVDTNEQGEIIVSRNQQTSLPGLYAAGDVTTEPNKQIIIAAGEGAKAALSANHYLIQKYKGE
ncbi:MAG: NAD(P)/FAD-dependent oxidoreductase [Bacillota bacterium]